MSKQTEARQARRALDDKLANFDTEDLGRPRVGWIRVIREALGMSAADLGARMGGVSRQSVYALEGSERAGTVSMSKLSAAAAAMNCRLVYAIVPNTTLEETVQSQAARIVDVVAKETDLSMALESQAVEPSLASRRDQIEDLIRTGRLWANRL